jgi:hypothetical protein
MLVLNYAALATVAELFRYKSEGFQLPDFPGYTTDQWGIKAHNRPWIEEKGGFAKGQRIIEVGGAYSLLAKYLADKYELEAWVGDDFGIGSNEPLWSRWGNPLDLPQMHPDLKYVFERFGSYSEKYPDSYFDRIFTVSTLEHIPHEPCLSVLKDMHRCLRRGGSELHTIDIPTSSPKSTVAAAAGHLIPLLRSIGPQLSSPIATWIDLIQASGVRIKARIPNPLQLLDRQILVESPDVVYRFYQPNNAPKPYSPSASMLLIIQDV